MTGAPVTVLLLHGLGTTGAVWHGVASALRASGAEVLVPDLPGHGRAPAPAHYDVDELAAAVVAQVPGRGRIVVAGHSLGGYVALALASGRFRITPAAVLSLGAKLVFSDTDRTRAAELAQKPVRWFASRADAEARYRLVAGLPDTTVAEYLDRGVVGEGGAYRLAADPAALAIVVPPFASLLAAARCPVEVARGEHDALVSAAECAALGVEVTELAGLGHNAQVEAPARVAALIARLVPGTSA